jgi:hypothetical protein
MALTDGQGIMDNLDGLREPYDGITQMIRLALADTVDMDPEKSPLAKAGVKLKPRSHTPGAQTSKNSRAL